MDNGIAINSCNSNLILQKSQKFRWRKPIRLFSYECYDSTNSFVQFSNPKTLKTLGVSYVSDPVSESRGAPLEISGVSDNILFLCNVLPTSDEAR